MDDHRNIEHKTMTPEALFHRAIKAHLNKRQQGLVMGAYRQVQAIIEARVQSAAPPEKHSCSCEILCVQGDLTPDEVTRDCKRSC